jgi:YVTN family beta-propeller protein
MKLFVYFISCLVILSSCSDERVINDYNDSWKAIVAIDNGAPKLQIIEYPSGAIANDDVYFEANGERLSSAPEQIAEYGGFIFLVQKKEKKITIISSSDYKKTEELDFSAENKVPSGIAFHLTSAYVLFENDSLVTPIDLTVFKKVTSINTGYVNGQIAADGNQVFITNPLDNKVSVIDTRVNDKVADVSVPDYPCLVAFDRYGKAVVVTAGKGKFNNDTATKKTEAYIMLIDTVTRTVTGKQPLGVGIVKPTEQLPFSITVASKLYSFICTQQFLLRYNTRTGLSVVRLDNGNFESAIYNSKRDELVIIKKDGVGRKLIVSPSQSYAPIFTKALPDGFICLLPK